MSKLVIVESPSKAKTIKKYLGGNYEVIASMGHVRDLPKKKMGVDIAHDFKPDYVDIDGKEDLIAKLKNAAADADYVYLATDPDREGEAISWHLAHMLALNENEENRVTFNEITKSGVQHGMSAPRTIDQHLVDAQQARRILDRIVGYKLSPFLWRKVRRGLSAGRVQSVAVRLIVDREEAIRKFVSEEYWTIDAALIAKSSHKAFIAHLHSGPDGKKIKIPDEQTAEAIKKELDGVQYVVGKVKKGVRNRQPAPPFITSTLQQEASRKLNMTSQRTMKVAQQLYEGVELEGQGATGLITYMRTDSLRISDDARAQGNAYIEQRWGKDYLPDQPRFFKSRANAQDGHEAIRPTIPSLTPEQARASLTNDQYRVYKLIWERFMASLMAACVHDTVSADIQAGDYLFKASGYSIRFDGFTVIYVEGKDFEEDEDTFLPPVTQGEILKLKELTGAQHFTQPPPRYTEATLIKTLEENGIGRPSTYAPTIATIISREYVERDKKNLLPTALGEVTTGLMKDLFKDIVDEKFTASMEKDLDEVEEGRRNYVEVLRDFYGPFEKTLEQAEQKMDGKRAKIPDVETDEVCEKCGKKMVIKVGRFGKFMACSGYPECKNTKPIVTETPGECPLCGGKILEKKSKKGYKYYGCEKAPTCQFMTWDVPLADRCPQCGKTLFKRRGGIILCADEACGYQIKVERKTKGRKKKDEEESPA